MIDAPERRRAHTRSVPAIALFTALTYATSALASPAEALSRDGADPVDPSTASAHADAPAAPSDAIENGERGDAPPAVANIEDNHATVVETATADGHADDPWAAFEADTFDVDFDDLVLDTVYFLDAPPSFDRFDLESARGREDIAMDQAQERGARTLTEAITNSTPWSPLPSTGAAPGPLLVDGLDGSWVQVLVDGIPFARTQTSRNGPFPDLANIPVDARHIERIEIYRGAGPAGTCGASGLVLNLITRAPSRQIGGSVTLDGGVGLNGVTRYGVRGDLSIPLGEAWALRMRAGFQRDLEVDVTNDGTFDRPRRDFDDAEIQALWRPHGEDRLTLTARTFGSRQRTIGNPKYELEDRTTNRGYGFDARYRTPDALDNRYTLRFSAQHQEHVFSKFVRQTSYNLVKARTNATALRGNLAWNRDLGDHAVAMELCTTVDLVERRGEAGDTPSVHEGQFCISLADTWRISDRLTLEATALGGYHDAIGARWMGGAAAVIRVNDLHGLRASFDAAQRVPTVEERYLAFDHTDVGYTLKGNPDLGEEQAFSGRVSWVYKAPSQRIGVEVSSFVTLLRNRIEPVLVEAASGSNSGATYSYINGGRGLSAGVDAVLRGHDFGGWFGFDLSYNALPIAKDPDTNDELSLRSHHSARLALRGTWLNQRLVAWTSAGIRSRLLWNGSNSSMAMFEERPPHEPAFLWDAGISGTPHDALWLGLTARNLTNHADPLWGPMPGFEVLFTIQASLEGKKR